MTDDVTTDPRPRVRAGSIAWGLIVIVTASLVLWVAYDPARRAGVTDWALSLTPGGLVVIGVLLLGGILLLAGVLAAIRRAQRRS